MGTRETIERLRAQHRRLHTNTGNLEYTVDAGDMETLLALGDLAIEARTMLDGYFECANTEEEKHTALWLARFDALPGAEGRGT